MVRTSAYEIKISVIIFIILISVIGTGLFSYKSLNNIVTEVSRSSKPETKLVLLKQILADVSDAENSVRTYNITHDYRHLAPFYNSVLTIDKNMEDLHAMVAGNIAQQLLLHQMQSLVGRKYDALNDML